MNIMTPIDTFDIICDFKLDLGVYPLTSNYIGLVNSKFKEVIEGIANVGDELTSINTNMKFEINSSI